MFVQVKSDQFTNKAITVLLRIRIEERINGRVMSLTWLFWDVQLGPRDRPARSQVHHVLPMDDEGRGGGARMPASRPSGK